MLLPQRRDDGLEGFLVPPVVGGLAEPQLPAYCCLLQRLYIAEPQQTIAEPFGAAEGDGSGGPKSLDDAAQALAEALANRLAGGRLQPQQLGQGMVLQMDWIVKVGQCVLYVMGKLIAVDQTALQSRMRTQRCTEQRQMQEKTRKIGYCPAGLALLYWL